MMVHTFKTIEQDEAFYKKCLVDDCHIARSQAKIDDKTCVFICHTNAS
jgi:hypothetical protein